MKADFHIHSTVSDGSDTISQIISTAKKKELDAIAITDHDTLTHLSKIPDNLEILVIGGIEVSSVEKKTNTKVHILGYNIQNPELVTSLTHPILEARNNNSQKQLAILVENGYKFDLEKMALADGKYLFKQHIMDYLVKTGQVDEMFGDFYMNTFKRHGICDFDIDYINVFDAIKTIKDAGGLAVLAHPGQQKNYWIIPELVNMGLDGLELNHHMNSDKDKFIISEIAKEFGLFMTGGSDYHGIYEPQIFGIGDFLSHESGVKAICHN